MAASEIANGLSLRSLPEKGLNSLVEIASRVKFHPARFLTATTGNYRVFR